MSGDNVSTNSIGQDPIPTLLPTPTPSSQYGVHGEKLTSGDVLVDILFLLFVLSLTAAIYSYRKRLLVVSKSSIEIF